MGSVLPSSAGKGDAGKSKANVNASIKRTHSVGKASHGKPLKTITLTHDLATKGTEGAVWNAEGTAIYVDEIDFNKARASTSASYFPNQKFNKAAGLISEVRQHT
jgi:hypothetical protein